jgi:hypothetical protein
MRITLQRRGTKKPASIKDAGKIVGLARLHIYQVISPDPTTNSSQD